MRELMARAAAYGLTVHGSALSDGKIGRYVPHLNRIYFDLRLNHAQRRSVIAHELGHAHYGHDCDSPRNERQADAFAAGLLVDPLWYAELENINPDAEWIAEEMRVSAYVIVDYRTYCLTRMGRATYAEPRMGVGQWRHRQEIA